VEDYVVVELLAMPLKDRLRELRTAAGLTQQELAVKAGLSVSAVVQLEAGRVPDPRVSTMKALAKALGCSVDDMIANGGEGDQPTAKEPPAAPPKRGRGKRK
jgi:transcriptional regulator with XRE-family HTH domain